MATFNGFVSNAIVYGIGEQWGHPFEEVTVTYQAGMTVGSLLKVVSGVYVWAAPADAANVVAVLADNRVQASDGITLNGVPVTSGNFDLVVAVRAAGLGGAYLKYSDGSVVDAAGQTALKALGFKINAQF